MKTTSKKKIIVSTLAIAMGAALAGSISGSVAWYQYSTRAAAQIQGTAAGTIGELQIQGCKSGESMIDGGVSNSIVLGRDNFKPMSVYKDGTDTKYVDAPVYQNAILPAQKSDALRYIDYELNFKFEHKTSSTSSELLAKNVYLVYFDIINAGTGADVSKAVRVEFLDKDGNSKFLLSDNASGETTTTSGNLDLNGNGNADTTEWDCKDTGDEKIVYKNHATLGASYDTVAHSSVVVDRDNTDPYDLELAYDEDSSTDNSGKALVATKASGWSDNLIVRVWLEGWALLGAEGHESASWTEDYIAQNFNINMQFACSAERQ